MDNEAWVSEHTVEDDPVVIEGVSSVITLSSSFLLRLQYWEQSSESLYGSSHITDTVNKPSGLWQVSVNKLLMKVLQFM